MGRRIKNPPYVHGFFDRYGRPRWYFRRPGYRRVALPGLPWSPEFMAAHEAAMNGRPLEIGASRTKPGTLNAAVVGYLGHELWLDVLSPSTRALRRPILERLREVHGDKPIARLEPKHIVDRILAGKSHHAKKAWLKTLRGLLGYCLAEGHVTSDPTRAIKLARPMRKSNGHMTWLEEQVEQYRAHHALGTSARLALELMMNVAARRQDACVLGRQHERNGKLTWRPKKTMRSTGKLLTIRILPSLRAAIDAMPPSDALTFVVTDRGKPFASSAAFGNKFADWCREAGLATVECDDGRIRNFRAHGLRKAACRQLAHAGCTALEIQAVSGHATLGQVQVYIDAVEQDRMAEAAMLKQEAGGAHEHKMRT